MKIIYTSFIIFFLSACVSTQKNQTIKMSAGALKEQQLFVNGTNYQKDTVALTELAVIRLQRYEANKNLFYLNQVISIYEELFKRQPYNNEVLLQFYRLNLFKGIATNNYDVEHWQAFYQQQPFLQKIDIAPPTYMTLPLAARDSLSTVERINILQKTVKDNPYFVNGYMDLSAAYAKQNKAQLSLFLLETAAIYNPKNSDILGLLNEFRVDKIFDEICQNDVSDNLIQAFEDYKFLVKTSPNDAYYHMQFSTVLRLMGRMRMSSFSAKKAASIDAKYQGALAEAEFWLGNNNAVSAYFAAKDITSFETEDLYLNILFNVVNFNWQQAANITEEYITRNDRSFYGVLYGAHAFKMLGQEDSAKQITTKGLINLHVKPWQQQMLNFANQQITSKELMAASKDSCNKSEAYFIRGLTDIKSGKMADAQQNMEAVEGLNIYPFYEYAGAKQIVTRLKSISPEH
ncbi:hypothetical protein EKO29_00360 [Colwellia sp. Arc7-635]|uniref:hypothetical protein n=1 Tax=Colwellia sp. Arc7-635 TaxID=2497879 RepID=UPI000F8524E0|nr:hypothetical protein [Colwellia sp. Arc7-635]AZQ82650.1 hypothetical protein EKO29_00360 [Colwellia sp. Arc7-635]